MKAVRPEGLHFRMATTVPSENVTLTLWRRASRGGAPMGDKATKQDGDSPVVGQNGDEDFSSTSARRSLHRIWCRWSQVPIVLELMCCCKQNLFMLALGLWTSSCLKDSKIRPKHSCDVNISMSFYDCYDTKIRREGGHRNAPAPRRLLITRFVLCFNSFCGCYRAEDFPPLRVNVKCRQSSFSFLFFPHESWARAYAPVRIL